MSKYAVLTLLWSKSQQRYIQPGEIIGLDDGDSATLILLEKGCITVSEYDIAPPPREETRPTLEHRETTEHGMGFKRPPKIKPEHIGNSALVRKEY